MPIPAITRHRMSKLTFGTTGTNAEHNPAIEFKVRENIKQDFLPIWSAIIPSINPPISIPTKTAELRYSSGGNQAIKIFKVEFI